MQTPFWCPDPSLSEAQSASVSPAQFVIAPAGTNDTEQILKLYAACSDPGFNVVSVREVSNVTLTGAFQHRLAQLQTRSGNPPFRANYRAEPHPSHRDDIVRAAKALARPFSDISFPDVSILPVWHGTSAGALSSILNGSFANLASTDSGYYVGGTTSDLSTHLTLR